MMEYVNQYVNWDDPWTFVVLYILFMVFVAFPSLRMMWSTDYCRSEKQREETYGAAIATIILAPLVVPFFWIYKLGKLVVPFFAECVLPKTSWLEHRRKDKDENK